MKTDTLYCDNCGASLKVTAGQKTCKCEYCDSVLPIPQKMFDDINKADYLLKENEKLKQNKQRDEYGEKAFLSDKRSWNTALTVWAVAVCAFLAAEKVSPLLESFWPSLLIMGGPCMIAAKPRKVVYMGFQDAEKQKKVYHWITLWRRLLYAWAIVMSVCWGVPEAYKGYDTMFNIGFALLIAGLIFFIRCRPAKYKSA